MRACTTWLEMCFIHLFRTGIIFYLKLSNEKFHSFCHMIVHCTFFFLNFTVDTLMPVISACPENIEEETSLEVQSCFATWTDPIVSDNSGIVSRLSQSHQPGSQFPPGTTVVMYTYGDPTGNTAVCTFTVTCTPGRYLCAYLFYLWSWRCANVWYVKRKVENIMKVCSYV